MPTRRAMASRLLVAVAALVIVDGPLAVAQGTPEQPAITVGGTTYTPRSIVERNMGTSEDQTTAFPPHQIVGNVYYVGTRTLSAFLVTTPAGHILINSTYERNVPTIARSVAQLGFAFADVKVLLGTHAHDDHQEGDALVKTMTGASLMAMREDVPALRAMRPGGKEHVVDRILGDGDQVTLGGVTLTAHLTPGHTHGCTTWTMQVVDGGTPHDVVFACSYRAPGVVTPAIEKEFEATFARVRALPCDVPLGDHPAQYDLATKYAARTAGGPNPFVDRAHCWAEADLMEAMFRAQLLSRRRTAQP